MSETHGSLPLDSGELVEAGTQEGTGRMFIAIGMVGVLLFVVAYVADSIFDGLFD